MSNDTATDENLISQATDTVTSHVKETVQLLCLCAILSTYLFVMLTPQARQNNKALGGR